jgi:glycosyltransferase involved in cell wall biosynthesis
VVLLNSDTIVTSKWLSGLIACAKSDPRIGMVGPLSNTASWQSVPELAEDGDWASNQLPGGVSIEEMGRLVREFSSRLYPIVPLLNGFCLLIKRKLIDEIGFLDEVVFGDGYGEEDDYALRAGYVDWRLAIADDVYIYHAQSRSYTDEKRRRLSARAFDQLNRKHGQALVAKKVDICENSLILEGIRARTRAAFERRQYQQKGHLHFAKKRILFVLPVNQPGGGANVVVYEAEALNRMGIEVRIFNLSRNKDAFESMYPRLSIPVIYGRIQDLSTYSRNYDAVIATYNISVQWLADIEVNDGKPVRAYYVQGYEPYIYPIDSEAFFRAKRSYDLFENLIRFTKTEWTRREVKDKVGVDSSVVGVSADIDLFRPRKHGLSDHPIKVAAMIRPDSAYRSPRMTMEILKQASIRYGRNIEVVIFGTTKDNPEFTALSLDFPWKLAGILSTRQVANLLADIDIFVDFSQHQAMGLTALEAMACGAAVIVPERGGATAFSRHEHNSLVVNTDSQARCWQALCRLIEDHTLRSEIRRNALRDVTEYYPERVAFRIVEILFDRKIGDCGIGQT